MVTNAGAAPARTFYSYGTYFAQHDPFNGDYTALLRDYNVPPGGGDGPAPADVRNLACGAQAAGIATGFMDVTNNKVSVYIQLDRVVNQLGQAPSTWLGTIIAQLGDLISNQAVLVELSDNLWNRGPVVRVGSHTLVETALNGDADLQVLGPFGDDDADTELVRTRRLSPIPPTFLEGIIALGRNATPRQVWAYVYPVCVDRGWLVSCAPFLDYLRCTMTCTTAGENPAIWSEQPPTPILPDEEMIARRNRILERDFPGLGDQEQEAAQGAIATEIGGLRADLKAQRREDDARRALKAQSTLTEYWGPVLSAKICSLCNVSSLEELPTESFYRLVADAKKHQYLTVLQNQVDAQKRAGKQEGLEFILTPAILKTVLNLEYVMASHDSVKTGLQPFRLHPAESVEGALNVQHIYELTRGENAAPSVEDAQQMSRASAKSPTGLFQVREFISRLEFLLRALKGDLDLADALNAYLIKFTSMESKLHKLWEEDRLLPALLMKRVAMKLSSWFDMQFRQPHRFPVPDFTETLVLLENEEPWKPNASRTFLQALGLSQPAATPPAAPGPGRDAARPRPRPAAPAPAAPAPAAPERPFNNVNFNTRFQPFRDSATTCRDVRSNIGTGPNQHRPLPPSRIDGLPMCLAFHAKGVCNPNCGRIDDHVAYSNEQYDELFAWCEECFPV